MHALTIPSFGRERTKNNNNRKQTEKIDKLNAKI